MSWAGAPRISVLLPVRNGGRFFGDALASILNQSFTDFELIVIDDGSTDGSCEMARATGDPRVVVIETGGAGVAAALNAGLAAARGELIARQDADDVSARTRFDMQVAQFNRDPDLTVLTSCVEFINERNEPIQTAWTEAVHLQWESANTHDEFVRLLPQTCCIVHGSVMLRRDVLVAGGGYDATLAVAQDYDLWLRLLPTSRFVRMSERLYAFRIHEAQVSATRSREQSRQAIALKLRYLAGTTALPAAARARIVGANDGAALYREAMERAGWFEVSGDADVTIFTNFATLDRDIDAAVASSTLPMTRVGNFLITAPLP